MYYSWRDPLRSNELLAGDKLERTIQQLLDMGGGSWDKDTVKRALRAAYNNPERAVDYLYSVCLYSFLVFFHQWWLIANIEFLFSSTGNPWKHRSCNSIGSTFSWCCCCNRSTFFRSTKLIPIEFVSSGFPSVLLVLIRAMIISFPHFSWCLLESL